MNVSSWLSQSRLDRLDAELILAETLSVERIFLHAHPDRELTEVERQAADELASRRASHEPLAYVLGEKEFFGRSFKVTADTLIPRPETEAIVEDIIKLAPKTVLDVGTGSGCIAITVALELPGSSVTAVDISPKALEVARENAQAHHAHIDFRESDLLENTEKYDLIVANLPYVDRNWDWLSEELNFEPNSALYAEDEGLDLIKKLIATSDKHLEEKGYIVLEADRSQHQKISDYAEDFGFKTISSAQTSDGLSLVLSR